MLFLVLRQCLIYPELTSSSVSSRDDLETLIFLTSSPKFWEYRYEPAHSALNVGLGWDLRLKAC